MHTQDKEKILITLFLFGCNTLAGKEKDTRTPAQYRHVLMEDGFTPEQAQRIASARYGDIGRSFRARMKMRAALSPPFTVNASIPVPLGIILVATS